VIGFGLLLLLVAGDRTLERAAVPQERATLLVDFQALDADGNPVTDLRPSELILRAGGRERRLASLELVRRDTSEVSPAVAPPFATNSAPLRVSGGDIIVLIDEASIAAGREHFFRDALTSFLTRVPPSSRVRLISLRPNGPALPFEQGLRDVKAALAEFAGHSSASETANDLVCRSQTALEILATSLGRYSGGPIPTVVIVSGGFGSPPSGGVTSFGNYGKCPMLQGTDFEKVGAAVRSINASTYVVHLTDATASRLPRNELERGVETLAGVTGAQVIRAATPSDAAMARIATQNSSYYLASFEPAADDRVDVPLRVDLRSLRTEVAVRTRPEIAGPRAKPAGAALPTPDAMIRVATSYSGLPLRAEGFVSRADADGKVRLVALFEPQDPATKVTAASIGLYDAKGRLTRWTAEAGDLTGRPMVAGIIVAPGIYRMRVAATSGAAAGTVDTEVRAELSNAGSVTMSALLVGVSGPKGFLPRMQFSASDKGAFGYLELYKVPKNVALTVTLELAATADGPALASDDVPLTAGPTEDVRVAFSGFVIDGMPPGDIVMRAIVSMDGKPVGRTLRTLRKVN
jgi:hypothetical protein